MSGAAHFWKLVVKDVGELRSWLEPSMEQITAPHVTVLFLGDQTNDRSEIPNIKQNNFKSETRK